MMMKHFFVTRVFIKALSNLSIKGNTFKPMIKLHTTGLIETF